MAVPRITIGCDPELFIRNKKTKQFISAHNLIPGTKEKPYATPFGAIQVDGVAAEFNITPANSAAVFSQNITQTIMELQKRIGPDNELVYEPIAKFNTEYFDKLPAHVKELGCNPDFNAWTNQVNPAPEAKGDLYATRTASGHVHIGWTKDQDPNDPSHIEDCNMVVRNLDYYLGLPSLMWDRDNRRRALYGMAGACRYKPYGVEYRTLSNKWLTDPQLITYVWNGAFYAVHNLFSGHDPIEEKLGKSAQELIDSNTIWWKQEQGNKVLNTLSGVITFPDRKYQSLEAPKKPEEAKSFKEAEALKKKANHKYDVKTVSGFYY